MSTAQQSTTCQVHLVPLATISLDRIFEVRRLARDSGCQFVATKRRAARATYTGPHGGDAA